MARPVGWQRDVTRADGWLDRSQPVSVVAGDDEILAFPWSPPNPADYASFGGDAGHFCLLSRIETGPAPGYGMTTTETSNLYANVQNNNNIVWKNITVVDEVADGRLSAAIIGNFTKETSRAWLVFSTPKGEPLSIFDWGQVWLEATREMRRLFKKSGAEFKDIEQIDDTTYRVMRTGASIGPLELRPRELAALRLRFVPAPAQPIGVRVLALDLQQVEDRGVVGGQRFVVKTRPDRRGVAPDKPATVFDGVGWLPVGDGCGTGCC